jgi:hypothetical protein
MIPASAVALIEQIIDEAYKKGIVQFESNDNRPPIVSSKEIRFNGVGEQGHETFYYSVNDNNKASDGRYFEFCKTARKPYDDVVMKVLIVLKEYLGDTFTLTSDGSFTEEWREVRDEMEERYNIRTYCHIELVVD